MRRSIDRRLLYLQEHVSIGSGIANEERGGGGAEQNIKSTCIEAYVGTINN
jgi:hypothetical protein